MIFTSIILAQFFKNSDFFRIFLEKRLNIAGNTQWVNDNLLHIDKDNIDKDNLDEVTKFVISNHPNKGLTNISEVNSYLTIERISTYADAVTVYCYEKVGYDIDYTFNNKHIYNKSTIANAAYISIFHSNKEIRTKAVNFVINYKNNNPFQILDYMEVPIMIFLALTFSIIMLIKLENYLF